MVSDSGISSSPYAAKARHLMKVAQQLRDVGAQTLLDIPRIAVIGGQSAGKSSLVEAVSGIRVPRSSGTCTRCPIEVNLTNSSESWNCRISLRFQFDANGVPLKEVQKIPFGPVLVSNDEVELQLVRAQAAILSHPRIPTESFLDKNPEEIKALRATLPFSNSAFQFSKNVIDVNVRGPDCTDVAFVDLPGLVQNDSRQSIELVEDIVRSNIQGRCIILVAIPMSDDMENQRSMRMSLEADPERIRTIGVLTKPDTLSKGSTGAYQRWMDIIAGRHQAHALKLGYYCVRLADDEERSRDLLRLEREKCEMDFFDTTAPWSTILQRGKLGVRNVVTDLSRHLTGMLDLTLPELGRQAKAQLTICKSEIAKLPAVLEVDPTTEIHNRVAEFSQDLSAAVKGRGLTSDNDVIMIRGRTLVQSNRAVYDKFKNLIQVTAPDFRPFDDHTKFLKPPFTIEDEGNINHDSNESRVLTGRCGPYNLRHVRKVIKDCIAWELPNNIHFDAKRQLISKFTCLWDQPAAVCCDEVVANLECYLQAIVDVHFKRYPKLLQHMRDLVMDLVESQKITATAAVHSIVGLEKDPLFTQNSFSLDNYQERCLTHYRDVRRKNVDFRKPAPAETQSSFNFVLGQGSSPIRPMNLNNFSGKSPTSQTVPQSFRFASNSGMKFGLNQDESSGEDEQHPTLAARALHALGDAGYVNLKEEDLTRLVPPDQFEKELTVMADVRAYFQVAHKRIIDNVPLVIEHSLNQSLAGSIKNSLLRKLGFGAPGAPERLAELLEEDLDVRRHREELQARKTRLEQILKELRSL